MPSNIRFQVASTATGNGTAFDTPMDFLGIQIANSSTNAMNATVAFEATMDDVTWRAHGVTSTTGGAKVTTATAVGAWIADVRGLSKIRCRISVWTAGTLTVTGST